MTTLLTIPEVQARLRCGRKEAYRLVKDRELSAVRIQKRILVPEDEVEKLIRRNTNPARRQFLHPVSGVHQ